jgi:aminocarboxymuconate-semialdehyde decarboxylase
MMPGKKSRAERTKQITPGEEEMKIDIYTHITTEAYGKAVAKLAPPTGLGKKMVESQPTLWDLDARFRIMDRYDDYMQVIAMIGPPVESVAKGQASVDLARLANDEAARLVAKHPTRFLCGLANLPLGDTDAALKELERAVHELKLKGIFLHTPLYFHSEETKPPAGGKPLDSPELIPIYQKMAEFNLPIWIHPNPLCDFHIPDYTSEAESKYSAWHVFGWPYQDTIAQVRLVFSGILEKYPTLKFINHHAGGMIPFFERRMTSLCNMAEMRVAADLKRKLSKPPRDYFRLFYNDTAIGGSTAALMCAYDFCGADHLLFGTDMPFDMELGNEAVRETIRSIERMGIPEGEKEAIFEKNARRILLFD